MKRKLAKVKEVATVEDEDVVVVEEAEPEVKRGRPKKVANTTNNNTIKKRRRTREPEPEVVLIEEPEEEEEEEIKEENEPESSAATDTTTSSAPSSTSTSNLAASTSTTLTCSSSITSNFGARHALPGAKNMDFWLASSEAPGWLCAEFDKAKVIGTVQLTMFKGHSEGCNYKTLRILGGNDNKNWKEIFLEKNETAAPGKKCVYELDNKTPFKYLKLEIDEMRDKGMHPLLHRLVLAEVP